MENQKFQNNLSRGKEIPIEDLDLYINAIKAKVKRLPNSNIARSIVRKTVYNLMEKAYFGESGLLERESCNSDVKREHVIVAGIVGDISKNSLIGKLQKMQKLNRYHKRLQESEEKATRINEEYLKHKFPYELAARKLARKCNINMDIIISELESHVYHFPT